MAKVYIIGAGPGDEGLLTLRAIESIKKCDVILYDRLISNNIFKYVKDGCEPYYCGKEPGCHYKTQDEINEIIVKLAKEGKTIGRIKGGDPYVFGRGGEEVLALEEHNIEFEVIPGITSPIAVLNYAGIPITHRNISQGFHVVTATTAGESKINWDALSKESGTLVFMMGLENLSTIINNLIKFGKNEDASIAVIMRGTTAKQKVVMGTLKNIEEKVKKEKLQSPCIIVVGEVIKLRDKLNWYENKPLFGANICITRSKKQSENLNNKLRDLGAEVTEINSIRFNNTASNLKPYIEELQDFNHIIFTSVNSVNFFFNYLKEQRYDIRNLKAKFSVIGKATGRVLEDRGIIPFIISSEFLSKGLVKELKVYISSGDRILIPTSASAKSYIENNLKSENVYIKRVNIYETLCGEVKNPKVLDDVDIVLYSSPSTVKNMINIFGIDKLKEKCSIAIGPVTNEELKENGIDAKVCKTHCDDGFISEIENIYKKYKEGKRYV